VSYIPKYINIKKQSILKLLGKILYKVYEVTGVTNSVVNTTKHFLLQVPCGQIVGWLPDSYWKFKTTGLMMNNCTIKTAILLYNQSVKIVIYLKEYEANFVAETRGRQVSFL
jgi:hypothetical protein